MPDTDAVRVSAIGGPPGLADAAKTPLDTPSRVLMGATAQGLVRFDAAGQIEPGLAERWIVGDAGMSYIFRLRPATWADGRAVTAADVVRILRRQIAVASRNPLRPYLTAIDQVVEMTPQVIEVRLARPRPDLLRLFAQPELALVRRPRASGSGPFVVVPDRDTLTLRPSADADRAADEATGVQAADDILLTGERAARAILRFSRGRTDLVLGGTLTDWPLLATVDILPAALRIDPAAGLFGLRVADRTGLLAAAPLREAVAMTFDRAALAGAVSAEWPAIDRLLPDRLDSAAPPAGPAWSALPLDQRRAEARARVAAWRATAGTTPALRIALPAGPGMTRLWGHLAPALLAIGITPERVAQDAPADLRLVDEVAPYDSARWYLGTACAPCGDAASAAVDAARLAPTLAARATAIAAADTALVEDVAFIPLARPLRWSLVSRRVPGWQPNARAWHPLIHLRRITR